MKPEDMYEQAGKALALLKALGSHNRLMIACQLVEGERSVGDLADRLGIREAAASQQLALLRKDGLVTPRREGRTIYYSLAGDAPRRVLETLYELYCKEPGKTLPPASEMPPE
tara:strand:+ start:1002 stop:1340 length:339 start_codon:yes stop_codon:yes gene_type:complete